jgi:hypothetical protein
MMSRFRGVANAVERNEKTEYRIMIP